MTEELNLAQSRILIAGLGVSGRAVRSVLTDIGSQIVTVDAHADDADVTDSDDVDLAEFDVVVASPGWPPSHPLLRRAYDRGIPIMSEVEIAWRLRVPNARSGKQAVWLAVTGTNGKTTTTQMAGAILHAAGVAYAQAGNIGDPISLAARNPELDVIVVELSSFQLHYTYQMQAYAAAIINIAPDHLDWHGGMDAYLAAKEQIFHHVTHACIYPVSDETILAAVQRADVIDGARAVGFTRQTPGPGMIGIVEDLIVDRAFHTAWDDPTRMKHAAELATLADLAHLADSSGQVPSHVLDNALAAATLTRAYGVPAQAVAAGLRSFTLGHHRIETIATLNGVRFVDDSKATNPHAALASLRAQPDHRVVWIAGGLSKGVNFDGLVSQARDKLASVVLIGVEHEQIKTSLVRHAPNIPVVVIDPGDTETVMKRAVQAARDLATSGDVVLLAPACASMDQFKSYAERGDSFAAEVRSLAGAAEGV